MAKLLFFFLCFKNDFHKNYDSQNNKSNMGLFEGRICGGWEDSRHASAEFDEGI